MTLTKFGEPPCRKVLAQLDSYIDNELHAETNLELMEHFQGCAACTGEERARRQARMRLQSAVREVRLPSGLEDRVRGRLREARRPGPSRLHLMSIAATLALCFGSWAAYRLGAPRHTPQTTDSYIASVAGRVNRILRVGLVDHLHCGVIRQHDHPPVPGSNKLSAEWKELVPVLRRYVPGDLAMQVAHECSFSGRKFIHVTFRNGDHLLSMVIARKQDGEVLSAANLPATLSQSDIPVYSSGVEQFQIAAFEDPKFLVFTISDLPSQQNLHLLMAMAPALQNILIQAGA